MVFIALSLFMVLKMGRVENETYDESRMDLMNTVVHVTAFVHGGHMNDSICHGCTMAALVQQLSCTFLFNIELLLLLLLITL